MPVWPIMDLRTDIAGKLRSETQTEGIPAVLPGFLVEGVVGVGGMAIVYAVRNFLTGQRLALKTIRVRDAADAGIVGRFWREVSFALRVVHPNVAPVIGHGVLVDGRPYALMDLYTGRTLGEMVRQDGPLALGRAIDIVDQVLAGLEAVHAAGIVHRDLTPENVFIERDASGRDRALVLDFGFAHEPGVDTGDGVTEDSRGALVGTMGFMSPEQMMRGRAITTRSDLFVAAVLLYYALCGKLPFRGDADVDIAVALLRRSPIPLRMERTNVPRALETLLTRALAKHPDARYADAAEMRVALAGAGRPATTRVRVGRERRAAA